eukprot:CAMPEP_0182454896 /NCGR_PEP_ID=MMETSP1319-20130603/1318_1 /TAXON_ID=172717 /ORGANISM="Bolidomonas pacifica, Strain RCC208" /LENGTH=446 /DNA_ID=CAMNT_0024652925 /DNA_START=139 /DNA_END=1475 /DNA_ORIENTATION=-
MLDDLAHTSDGCVYDSFWDMYNTGCSGHGTCSNQTNTGTCDCFEGWTGESDFLNPPDSVEYDCHINIARYRFFWITAVILSSVAIVQACYALRMSWLSVSRGGGGRKLKRVPGFRHRFMYRPSTQFLLCVFTFNFCGVLFGVRRIQDHTKVLAPKRWYIWTLIFFFAMPSILWAVSLLARLCLNLCLSGVGRGDPLLAAKAKKAYKRIMLKGYVDHFMLVVIWLSGLVGGEGNRYNLTSLTYMITQGYFACSCLLVAYQFNLVSLTIREAFHGQTKKDTLKVRDKLNIVVPLIKYFMMVASLGFCVFIIFPKFYKHWGILVLLIMNGAPIGCLAATRTFLVKKRSSNSGNTLGNRGGSTINDRGSTAYYRASAGHVKPNPEFPLGSPVGESSPKSHASRDTEGTVSTVGGVTVIDGNSIDEDDEEYFTVQNPMGNPRLKPSKSDVA